MKLNLIILECLALESPRGREGVVGMGLLFPAVRLGRSVFYVGPDHVCVPVCFFVVLVGVKERKKNNNGWTHMPVSVERDLINCSIVDDWNLDGMECVANTNRRGS